MLYKFMESVGKSIIKISMSILMALVLFYLHIYRPLYGQNSSRHDF